MTEMTYAESFALNEWLSEHPADKTYDEVCELIRDEDERVCAWQWFETMPPTELVENIDNTRSHFEHTINRMRAEGVFE
jgi:hypothetical protein